MKTLDRKLLRELGRMRGQVASIAIVVASGVSVIVSMAGALQALQGAASDFYRSSRFAEMFVSLTRAPEHVAERVREIPGVAAVDTRVIADARLVMDDPSDRAMGRFVSLQDDYPPNPVLNMPVLRSGGWPAPRIAGGAREAVVSEGFAVARGLEPGDSVRAVLEGRLTPIRISGIAVSAEYVYAVMPGEFLPDDRSFGIFWIPRREIASAVDMDGAFNDLSISLAPGASEPDVRARVDTLLAVYGSRGATPRADQFSHQTLQSELESLRVTTFAIPALFLGVAAFLLNVVLARQVGTQRGIIAVLKAFGYSNAEVASHYRRFAIVIVAIGSVVGILAGSWLGRIYMNLYRDFFRFPSLEFALHPWHIALAVGVSLFAALAGSRRAVRNAATLAPAAAMRPEPPPTYRPTVLERLGIGRLLSARGRMVLREVGRRPGRTIVSTVAVAFSMAIMVTAGALTDGVNSLMGVQFTQVQREDLAVSFDRTIPFRVMHDLARVRGVHRVEPMRIAPARVVAGHRSEMVPVEGRIPNAELRRLLGADLRPVPLPPEGMLLTRWLATDLHVSPGDTVVVQFLEDSRKLAHVQVAGITDEPVGGGAVMDYHALAALLEEQPVATGVLLRVDAARKDSVIAWLERAPRVAAVTERAAGVRRFREEYARLILQASLFLALFSAVIAVGVVYNGARIALAERARDLGVLRVLGFRRHEVASLLLSELGVQVVAALPVGAVIGYAFAVVIARAVSTDVFRVPAVVEPSTMLLAALVVLLSGLASALLVRRRLYRLDMVQVLKAPE